MYRMLLIGALCAISLRAQIVSGSIVGTLRDSSNAAIPGAQVIAKNAATGMERQVLTDAVGNFSFPTLPPGKWSVTANRAGFKSETVSDIDLLIAQTARVDITLQVGQVSDTVKVEAVAPTLETETPTIGQVIEGKPVVDLPLNGRNFIQLATLSAGVAPATGTSTESSRLGRTQITAHVAGSRGSYNSYLIDGMESRGARFGELPILPSVDAVQEFKIQRNYYSAEYGGNTGIISLSIKSGANDVHGTVYEFLRNSDFDARQFFDGPGPSPFKLNQYGFSVGGPIKHDRTFFFANYEGRRQRRATQSFATVPSPALLTGDLSSLPTKVTDPFNGNAPFPGNVIPASRISNFARNYAKFIPTPIASLPQGNYVGAPSADDDFDQVNLRLDHRFSSKDSMFARYSQSNWNVTQPGLLPYRGLGYPLNGQNAVMEETRIFSATTVNTVKLGFSRSFLASALINASQDLASQVGLHNLAVLPYDYSLPNVGINGYSAMGYAANTFRQYTNDYALSDTVALTRGRHNLTVGGDIRETRTPSITTNGSNGGFSFTNRFTGAPIGDFLLGSYTTASAQLYRSERDYRFNQYAAFVQDNWRVSSRLSLNLGVRYEYQQPWRDKSGAEGYFDPSLPGLRLARSPQSYGFNITAPWMVVGGVREGVIKPDFRDFAPRVGLAFRATNKTVLRAGYGIFYAMPQGNDAGSISQNPGASISASYTNSPGTTPRLADTLFDTAVQSLKGASTQLLPADPNRRTAYMQQWSFNVERQLDSSTAVEIGYIGSKGTHLMDRLDINQAVLNAPGQNLPVQARRPYSQFQSILTFEGNEISDYNGLTVRVERRFAAGISYLANYTWSKSMDTSSRSIDDGGSAHENAYNMRGDYGLSAFDLRHRFTSSTLWELPFGKGKPLAANFGALANRLVSGWQMNTILQLQTGNPFSVTAAGDIPNVGGTFNVERPDRIGNGILPKGQRTPARWFDTSAFALNALNTFGNAGRDVLFQDGLRTLDVSMFKNNYFGERNYNLQFRAEFFNILNDVNFGRPGRVINGANFGVVTDAGAAREIQVALKFIF